MAETLGQDFLDECVALDDLVDGLDEAAFARVTDFYGWTVRDEVMHLMFLDETILRSIEDEAAFLAQVAEIRAYQKDVGELSQYMRARYAELDRDALVARWRQGYAVLAARFAISQPKTRIKWFGPDMSLVSAASARQMEVWAHGQDLYDLFGVPRVNRDRIRNICEIGVRTFGWTFANRCLTPPGAAPRVALTAPSGTVWTWNADGGEGLVAGPAEDFAAIVTQRRHLDDTRLTCEGPSARPWLLLAQCFAGAPSDGPAPGRGPLTPAVADGPSGARNAYV